MRNRLDDAYSETFNAGRPQYPLLRAPHATPPKKKLRARDLVWLAIGVLIGQVLRFVIPLLAVALLAVSAHAQSPASELQAALQHCEQLPANLQQQALYLTTYALPEADRDDAAKVLSYTVNAVSRTRAITPPKPITNTLWVCYIANYAPSPQEYFEWATAREKLGETDSTFHLRTQVASNIHRLGKSISTATVDGGWIGLANAQRLKLLTRSNAPILRADYFVAAALSTPRYYELAGVPKTEAEFVKVHGLQPDVIEKLRANAGANLLISNVTQKPRRVIWSQSPLGGYYATLDVERVDAERDPIRRPITAQGLAVTYDATEIFAMQQNGLWRVALYDAKGKQQQTVPDRVAKDTSDPHGDGIVTPLVSCIRCHTNGGLKPFSDDQVKLLAKSVLQSYDPNIVLRALEFYDDARLQRQMQFDRETYEAAVKKCTGDMDSKTLAEALAKVVRDYSYLPVTIEQAARECGVSVQELQAIVITTHDPILLSLLEGRGVLRGQWDSSQAEAQLACATRRKVNEN